MANRAYRPIAEFELPAASDVYLTSRVDLQSRLGQAPSPISAVERSEIIEGYQHIYRTGIFRAAEIDGRIIGVCCAIIRDEIWFLSGFWLLPEFQRKGIGGGLLDQVFRWGIDAGAKKFCVCSSLDPAAQRAYLKHGMMPGYPVYRLVGPADVVVRTEESGYEIASLDVATAARIDRTIRGTPRKQDHQFWFASGLRGICILSAKEPVGYFYYKEGAVAAGAWLDAGAGESITRLALAHAAVNSETVGIIINGSNHAALRTAISLGLTVAGIAHFLTTETFGKLHLYLPSGPLLY